MSIKDISPQRKRELEELAQAKVRFIPELFAEAALIVHRGLIEKIPMEQIEPPCEKIMRICEDLPRGEAMMCLMVALTDHWTRMREKYELERGPQDLRS